MHRSCFPLEVHLNTGRLCLAGSGCHPVPRRHCSYAALRLPRSLRPRLRSPLASGLPRRGCLFFAEATYVASAGRARIRKRTSRRRVITGPPLHRTFPEEERGSPRCLGRPLAACRGRTPRRMQLPLALLAEKLPSPSGKSRPSASGISKFSWLLSHGLLARAPTHRRSRYRGRRKARYRLGGLTPGRAGIAPAGRRTEFQ